MEAIKHKMVIVVRKDLELPKGKMAAQVAHAAVNATLLSMSVKPEVMKAWYGEGQKKVVVKVDDLKALEDLMQKTLEAGIMPCPITDFGLTVVAPGTVTCMAIGPDTNEKLDPLTGHLRLV